MHPTARRTLLWGIVLLVGGSIVTAYGTDLYLWLAGVAGANADAGLHAVSLVINVLRGALLPLGGALVAAAVVINTLAPLREPAAASARGE